MTAVEWLIAALVHHPFRCVLGAFAVCLGGLYVSAIAVENGLHLDLELPGEREL